MKFSVKEDIEGPADAVFAELSDFAAAERAAERRNVKVTREGDPASPRDGLGWTVGFSFRGAAREAKIELTEYDPPKRMVFDTSSGGLEAKTTMDVVALSRTRTRVSVEIEMSARTLSGRLLLQSLKLARGTVEKRLKARSTDYANELEARLKKEP